MILWKSKKIAWSWIAIHTGKSMVWFMFDISLNLKYGQWFANIHVPFFRFSKHNTAWSIGTCLGKYYIDLYRSF